MAKEQSLASLAKDDRSGFWRNLAHQIDRRGLAPGFFLAPYTILFLVFGLFPLLFSIYLSFHFWNPVEGLQAMEYVGFENYLLALEDPWFWQALKNTFLMALLSGLPQHLVAIPLAFVLASSPKWLRQWSGGALFFPYITSGVVVALIFFHMYSAPYGLFNSLLAGLSEHLNLKGLKELLPVRWLDNAHTVQGAISFVVFWKYTGFNVIIYTTGLMTIPKELHEAARIDGAGPFKRFWYISLPHLRPFILFAGTLSVIGGLQLFEEPFILTRAQGGPSQNGLTVAHYLMRVGWEWLEMGQAAALAWILFVIIGGMSLINYVLLEGRRKRKDSL